MKIGRHLVAGLPYSLQLAHGMTRLPLMINAILLLVVSPLTIVLASAHGSLGGAMAWLILCRPHPMPGPRLSG